MGDALLDILEKWHGKFGWSSAVFLWASVHAMRVATSSRSRAARIQEEHKNSLGLL